MYLRQHRDNTIFQENDSCKRPVLLVHSPQPEKAGPDEEVGGESLAVFKIRTMIRSYQIIFFTIRSQKSQQNI